MHATEVTPDCIYAELTPAGREVGGLGKTPLVELLDAHPAPWRTTTAIFGPPGQAQIAVFDAIGDLVETRDDIGLAEALVEAVNVAAGVLAERVEGRG